MEGVTEDRNHAIPKPMEWKISAEPVPYPEALAAMEARVTDILTGKAEELVWLLEHPALYTAGTSADKADLLQARFPVYEAGRGGEYTYHGPGQRIAYAMLNLEQRTPDLRKYVRDLEQWLINTLAVFGVQGERRDGRIGIWVANAPDGEAKIAAIGIRVRKWVTFHGISLNVNPDLSHFSGIVPCGIRGYGVTSLAALGVKAEMADVDAALQQAFSRIF